MSIQSQITRIKNNVQNTLTIIRNAGLTVASDANSDSLPDLVDELANDVDGGSFVELPDGYTHVEYIESTGSQYIDTGVIAKSGLSLAAEFAATSVSGDTTLAGARSGNVRFYMFHVYSGCAAYGYGAFANTGKTLTAGTKYAVASELSAGNQTITVNGGVAASATDATSYNTGLPMFLFASNRDGAASAIITAKMYSCKIYDNGTLVRQYFPCINPSGVVGLYDLVNGTFNSGVGTFTAGRAVVL